MGLAAKLAICLVASTAAFFSLFGYLNLREQREYSTSLVLQSAERITDIILRSTQYQMMHNDREALYHGIHSIGSEPGIRRIRIFNKEGRISFSTDPTEVGTVVDKRAEACYGCHAQAAPLARLERPDRARVFTDARGERVLGVIRPIENAPGVLQRRLPRAFAGTARARRDRRQRLARQRGRAGRPAPARTCCGCTAAAVVLICFVSVMFIWLVVYRPIKELMDGTHRVAGGDLDYRLPVRSDDELGDLAASFNKMTAEVAGVQARDRRARAHEDGGAGARAQVAAAQREAGVDRQAGGHGGARDQQPAVRHPDLRAADPARRGEAAARRPRTR